MRVARQRGKLPLGFDWKVATRPGGFDLITLANHLNGGLTWPKCAKREAARRERIAKRVRGEIVQEVNVVLEALQAPSGSSRPLVRLIDKINSLGLRGGWTVYQSVPVRVSEDEVTPIDARALRIGRKWYAVDSSFSYSVNTLGPWSYGLVRQMFYRPLISALETGEFKRLRRCKWDECQKFFVAEDLRRDFCSDDCRIAFNNKWRLESGWFTEQRHKKRKRDIQKAGRLLKEGKPLEIVSKETGLSVRVLKRAGLGK